MGVRKQFPGGMVKGVSIPGQSFSNFQQASSSFNTLASKLDRMVNFAVSEGEKVAVAQGAEYAAANPISVQQYYDANPEEREKLVGGDKYTSYGKALRAAQINFLATDLAIKAEKDMVKLKTIAVGSNMDVEMYEAGLDGIVKGKDQSIDHNFCLDDKRSTLREVAVLTSKLSKIKLRVLSTEAGLQFYTGHHLLATPPGYSNLPYTPFSGLCLEPQGWPDAPNKENFPSVFLPANTLYQQIICFEFTTS